MFFFFFLMRKSSDELTSGTSQGQGRRQTQETLTNHHQRGLRVDIENF